MSDDPMLIVYDGECPFCSAYVSMLRLKDAVGAVELVDARTDHPVVQFLFDEGYDLDEGMALVRGFSSDHPDVAHGDECVHQLALLTTPSGVFNRLNAAILQSRSRSRFLYPFLKAGRNAALRLLGRKRISDTG